MNDLNMLLSCFREKRSALESTVYPEMLIIDTSVATSNLTVKIIFIVVDFISC